MLRRLLLLLLIACLAVPAVAMPGAHHAAPAGAVIGCDCHAPAPERSPASHGTAPAHDCIGCIAPPAPAGTVAPPAAPAASPLRLPLAAQLAHSGSGPDTPPPRT